MRHWRVFRELVLKKPVLTAVLLLIYLVGLWLIWLFGAVPGDQPAWLVGAMLVAFPAGAQAALASERLMAICAAAGQLGLPRHSEAVRVVQGILLAFYVVCPLVITAISGGSLSGTAAVLVLAFGLSARGPTERLRLPVVIGVIAIVFASMTFGANWLLHPLTHVVAIALGAVLIAGWFRVPRALEARAAAAASVLADVVHEGSGETLAEALETTPEAIDKYEDAIERNVARAHARMDGAGPSIEALALGLGFSGRPRWKSIAIGAIVCTALVGVAQLILPPRQATTAYVVVSAFIVMSIWGAIESIVQAWRHTHDEQTLILLAPHSLTNSDIKARFLQILGIAQIGPYIVWAVTNAVAVAAGWASVAIMAKTAAAMLACSVGASASVWALLARRSLRTWHVSTLLILPSAVVGAATLIVGVPSSLGMIITGAVVLFVPACAAGLALAMRPIQFPVMHNIGPGGPG